MLYDTVLISVLRRMKELRVSNLEHNLHSSFLSIRTNNAAIGHRH